MAEPDAVPDSAEDKLLDPARAAEVFERSEDFTIGLEEEFQLLDPDSLELVHRFEELNSRCLADPVLADSAAGELIASEIEIRSGRGEGFADAVQRQQERRDRLFAVAGELGIALGAMGTHPWASYLDQRIIDTPHYERLSRELRWVAQRNSTWSMHVHVGVKGADRAIAVCDHLRELLPVLLAVSSNSPFLDGRDTGLGSVRTQVFTRMFPRCGVHEPFRTWREYGDFVELLKRTGSAVEATQLWWSVRPHHLFGTVEVRICDAQSHAEESTALAELIVALTAQAAIDAAEGCLPEPLRQREIEENLWRAIRFGLDGQLIDFRGGAKLVGVAAAVEKLLEWAAPACAELGLDPSPPQSSGSQRARERIAAGASVAEAFRESVEETARTYPGGVRLP